MNIRFILASAAIWIAAASAHAGDSSFPVSGKWNSDFGLTELTEVGANVTGSYPFENGKIIGTRSGNRLTGQWIQSNSSRRCDKAVDGSYFHGQFVFDFSANEFVGKWGYCDDAPAEKWSGTRDPAGAPKTASQESQTVANAGGAASANSGSGPATCSQCPPWVSSSFAGNYLPLSAKAGTWSTPKLFSRKSGALTVQSRFMEQQGTTCKFEVQFNNAGANALDERIIVARPGKAAVGNNDFPLRAKLDAGASVAYATEVRECPLNWGRTQDMTKCASCQPMVYFVAE